MSLLVAGAVTILVADIYRTSVNASKPTADNKRKDTIDYLWRAIKQSGGHSVSKRYTGLTTNEIRKEFEPKGYTVTEDEIKW